MDGLKKAGVTLDRKALAGIYLGTIQKWNDPALAALGPVQQDEEPSIRARSHDPSVPGTHCRPVAGRLSFRDVPARARPCTCR